MLGLLSKKDKSTARNNQSEGLPALQGRGNAMIGWLMLGYAFVLLLVCSRDGFLRTPYMNADPNWFFMAGKAWMEGMTPYIDFADSKGPLLWLIYGIAYLLSPDSFAGVFLLEVLFFGLTFYLLYRSARLLVDNEGGAILASMMMALPFFFPGMHDEMRPEDFCQLFFSATLYALLRIGDSDIKPLKYGICLGLSCGAATMMKYNIGASLFVPSAVMFLYLCFKKGGGKRAWELLYSWFAGFGLIVLPFVFYFLIIGNFGAFINEYFLRTASTVNDSAFAQPNGNTLMDRWVYILKGFISILPTDLKQIEYDYAKMAFIALMFMPGKMWRAGGLWIALTVWFIVTLLIIGILHQYQYYFMLAIFFLPGICRVLSWVGKLDVAGATIAGVCVVAILAFGSSLWKRGEFYKINENIIAKEREENAVNLIAAELKRRGKSEGTIVYWDTYDMGLGVKARLLPGAKYWALQWGATPEMIKEHHEGILRGRPDFIVVPETGLESIKLLEAEGYEEMIGYNARPDFNEDGSGGGIVLLVKKI